MTVPLALALAETLFTGITKIAAWLKTNKDVTPEDLAKFEALDKPSRDTWDESVTAAKARLAAKAPASPDPTD